MTPHILPESILRSAVVTQWEQSADNNEVDKASAVMSAPAVPPGRRSGARMDYRRMCSYEILEAVEGESVVIGQGEAFALNRSMEGILLFMALAPHMKQLIEVHTPRFGWGRTANIFEVRWTRSVPVDSFGELYLVGCQRVFGPCHYLSV